MSLIKAILHQLGLSVTPANNFTLTAAADNGTMKLARGNAGATTQDIMTVDAAGKVAIPQGLKGLQPVAAVTFDGTPAGIGALTMWFAFNVASVTKNGVGNYSILFVTPVPDAKYTVSITLNASGPGLLAYTTTAQASSLSLATYSLAPAPADNQGITVTVFRELT